MTGGDGLRTHHNLLLMSNCCRTGEQIPAVSISKASGLYSKRGLTLSRLPIHFVGEEIAFMVTS